MQCQIHTCTDEATKMFARADCKLVRTNLYLKLVCERHLEALMSNVDPKRTDVIVRPMPVN